MKKKLLLLLPLIVLAGCDTAPTNAYQDQALRRQIFKECLESIPKGPEKIDNSNDWQEVVEECGDQADSMSYFNVEIPGNTGGQTYHFNNDIKSGEEKPRDSWKVKP